MNPNLDVSLESIIAACYRDLFVKQRVWKRFYEILVDARKKGSILEKDLTMLFYHNYIETELLDFDEADVDEIDADFLCQEVRKANKYADEQIERQLKKKAAELDECIASQEEYLEKESRRLEEERMKWVRQREAFAKKTLDKLKVHVDRRSWLWAASLTVVMAMLLVDMFLRLHGLGLDALASGLLSFITGGAGALGIMTKLRKCLYKSIYQSLRQNRMQDLERLGFERKSGTLVKK